MSDVKLPRFLREYDPNVKSEYEIWHHKYYEKFGPPDTSGLIYSREEYTELFKACIESNMNLNDYLNMGDVGEDDEI